MRRIAMYDYRRLTPEQREQILVGRKKRGLPWHSPPHYGGESHAFLITAACFDHRPILEQPERLSEFYDALVTGIDKELNLQPIAWVIQPNHYHILVKTDLDLLRPWLGRLHNGKSTQWNREDKTPERKVWFRFMDRRMRSENHYYATLNYIHANPAKHGYVQKATDWPWSSLHDYMETCGRDELIRWWRRYPVNDYGKGWDD
ncbi:MAG: transposase [Thermodesulfobacteriota bacterium]